MPSRPPRHQPTPQPRRPERRGSSVQRGYDRHWAKLRATMLAAEPLCRLCLLRGITTPATEVDHIVPHRGNQTRFWDSANLQALCKSCHSRKTGQGQ
jgi:5-methylcytosine-specific restriction enzyme A